MLFTNDMINTVSMLNKTGWLKYRGLRFSLFEKKKNRGLQSFEALDSAVTLKVHTATG
jgi:hypothetical protein